MKKFITLTLLFLFGYCHASENKEPCITTNDICLVKSALESLDEGDIAIFDCDDVLTFTPYFTNKEGIKIIPIFNRIKSSKNVGCDEKAVIEMSKLLNETPYTAVDKSIPNIIKTLQKKNIKTLVLTQCGSGKCGVINSMAKWKLSNLNRLGYDFKKSWNDINNSIFCESLEKITFPRVIKTSPDNAAFIDGVLFSGGFKKEAVLTEFLKYLKQKPKKILYIDDIKKNVESIKKVALKLNMEYIGIVYTSVEDSKFDKKCAEAMEKAKLYLDKNFPIG